MAINIPTIKRADPVQQQSIGRDQTQAPSAEPYIKNLNTVASVFDKGADLAFKFEKQAQDTELRDLTNKYKAALYGTGDEKESWTVSRFQKAPKDGQDFTPAFAGYQEYKQSLRDQVMSSARGGVAERLKTELADVDFYADRTVNVEFYKANNVRTDKIHSAEIDLIKQVDIPAAVGAYNPKDPETIKQLATTFNKIADSSMNHGLKLGFKEGDPVLQSMMRKDVGDAVVKSVNDALSVRDTDKATQIWMQFEKAVPNQQSEPLKKKIADIVIDKEIDSYVSKYKGFREDIGIAKIKTEVPEELRDETLKRFTKDKIQESERKNRISTDIKNTHLNQINTLRDQGNLPRTVKEYETKYGGDSISKLNPNDRQAIWNSLDYRPRDSDVDAVYQLNKQWRNNEMLSWSADQFEDKTIGLNKSDYNKFKNRWLKREEFGLQKKQRDVMYKDIELAINPYLEHYSDGSLTNKGKEDFNKIIEPYLDSEMNSFPKELTKDEYNNYVNNLKQKTKDKFNALNLDKNLTVTDQFKKVLPPKIINNYVPPVQNSTPVNQSQQAIVPNRTAPTTDDLKKLIKERLKK